MRIAMVFDGLGFGGVEKVGISYIKLLLELGHDVTVFNLQPEFNDLVLSIPKECHYEQFNLRTAAVPDNTFSILRLSQKWNYVYPLIYASSKLLSVFCELKFRLFHHKSKKDFDIAIAFAGTIRSLEFITGNYIKSSKKIAWLHGSLANYLLVSYSFSFLYSKIKNLCVLSTNDQDYALRIYPKLRESVNIFKIYNPIEQSPISHNAKKVQNIYKKYSNPFIMVGRFDTDKDQATVIKAIKILQDVYSIQKKLIFIGDGPTRKPCEELVKEMNLTEWVFFLGARADVDNYYAASCLAIHSSPAEGLPTVLLEAMRNNLPIVATNSLPGVPEILGADKYGMTCKVGSPEDMAEKIYTLISDSSLQQEFIDKGKGKIQEFAPGLIKEQLQNVLSNLK